VDIRHLHKKRGSTSRRTLHFKVAAQHLGSLADTQQAQATTSKGCPGVAAQAIVLYNDHQPVAATFKQHADATGLGVAGDVGESFLDDAV
jgi:hypothetical protein